ncbi:MAG TPA: SRPBCC family protein [Chthoniobacterales bacterium]|jgi:uncharacterized protein YndB with AHSA1/START domain|nr:SRPBCC family protein [Chthoniobacterales bacterium]
MDKPAFVYVTYIRTTPDELWRALTEPEFSRQYWGGKSNISDWKKGSKWQHVAEDEADPVYVIGEVLESEPPKRLVLTWVDPDNQADNSRASFEIEPIKDMVRLTVIHGDFKPDSVMAEKVALGWPLVLSSLKSFLETGQAIDISAAKCAK